MTVLMVVFLVMLAAGACSMLVAAFCGAEPWLFFSCVVLTVVGFSGLAISGTVHESGRRSACEAWGAIYLDGECVRGERIEVP